jgi:hypothetical protein
MANNKPIGVAYADPQLDSFQVGEANAPIAITSAGVLNGAYATTSATSGDTRLNYNKLTFTSTGSGETLRAFSVVTGANAATGGTINGAHISCEIDGNTASISGAANAIRATLGGTDTTPGGTLAAIQLDTNFGAGVTLPASASFLRVTESGTATLSTFLNLPAAMVAALGGTSATPNRKIKCVDSAGTTFFLMAVV